MTLSCFAFAANALAKDYSPYQSGKVTVNELNVRDAASASGNVVTQLDKGKYITLKGYVKNDGIKWYKITYKNQTAYVAADYVKKVSTLSYNVYTPKKKGKTTAEINVRKSPSTDGALITTLPKGKSLTLKGYKGNWYAITVGGKTGFVSADYVKRTSEGGSTSDTSKKSNTTTVKVSYGKTLNDVNVRSKASTAGNILTTLKTGHCMKIYGSKTNSKGEKWYKVKWNGNTAYVTAAAVKKVSKSTYEKYKSGGSSKDSSSKSSATSYGKALNDVNVRSKASTAGDILTTLKTGHCMKIYGSKTNSKGEKWLKVKWKGNTAYVTASAVKLVSKSTYEKYKSGGSSDSSASTKKYCKITTGVNVRKSAKKTGTLVGTLEEGTYKIVYGSKKDSEGNKWYKVKYGGVTGYIIASCAKLVSRETYNSHASTDGTDTSKTYGLTTAGVNVRSKASKNGSVITTVNENFAFVIKGSKKDSSGTKWYKLTYGGKTGYICADYVKKVKKSTYDKYKGTTTTTSKKYGKITTGVNVRKSPKKSGTLLGTLIEGSYVVIYATKTDSAGNSWYKIKYNGTYAYVIKDCVKIVSKSSYDKHAGSTGGSGDSGDSGNPGGGSGNSIVSFALSLQGCPYVYGAAGPSTFDCSGFTMYVYAHFGVNLPHYDGSQMKYGRSVGYANAQPGDLIFYGGHVGIYIGGGQIVHASSTYGRVKTESATYRTIVDVRRYI